MFAMIELGPALRPLSKEWIGADLWAPSQAPGNQMVIVRAIVVSPADAVNLADPVRAKGLCRTARMGFAMNNIEALPRLIKGIGPQTVEVTTNSSARSNSGLGPMNR